MAILCAERIVSCPHQHGFQSRHAFTCPRLADHHCAYYLMHCRHASARWIEHVSRARMRLGCRAGESIPGTLPWLEPQRARDHMLASNSQQLRRQIELNTGELRRLMSHDAPTLLAGRSFRINNLEAAVVRHAAGASAEDEGRAYVLRRALAQEQALQRADRVRLAGVLDSTVEDCSGLALEGDLGDAESLMWGSDDDASSCSSFGGDDEDRTERRAAFAEARTARAEAAHARTEPLYLEERTLAPAATSIAAATSSPGTQAGGRLPSSVSVPAQGVGDHTTDTPAAEATAAVQAAPSAAHEHGRRDDDCIIVDCDPGFAQAVTPHEALDLEPDTEIARVHRHLAGASLYASAFHELQLSEAVQPMGWLSCATLDFISVVIQVCINGHQPCNNDGACEGMQHVMTQSCNKKIGLCSLRFLSQVFTQSMHVQVELDSVPFRAGLVTLYGAHAFTLLLGPSHNVPTLENMLAFGSSSSHVYHAAPGARPGIQDRTWGLLPVHIGRHWVCTSSVVQCIRLCLHVCFGSGCVWSGSFLECVGWHGVAIMRSILFADLWRLPCTLSDIAGARLPTWLAPGCASRASRLCASPPPCAAAGGSWWHAGAPCALQRAHWHHR